MKKKKVEYLTSDCKLIGLECDRRKRFFKCDQTSMTMLYWKLANTRVTAMFN